MNISTLFFRNPYLLGLTIATLLFTAVWSILALPRLEDPRITNRDPIIITPFPGATAARVESLVTEPIEQALQEVVAIKTIESVSNSGVSIISVELDPGVTARDNKEIFAEIRDKVSEAAATFPPHILPPQIDDKRDPAAYTHITAVRWNNAQQIDVNLMNRVARELANRIRALDGTSLVRLNGEVTEEILAEVNPHVLAELRLTPRDLAHALANADAKSPAGKLRGDDFDINIQLSGQFESLDRIKQTPLLQHAQKGIVRLGDVAQMKRTFKTPEHEIATVNGERVIFVSSRMHPSYQIDKWSAQVDQLVDQFDSESGQDIKLDVFFEQGHYTLQQLSSLIGNLIAGALVVVAVVLVMMGWKAALIVGSALPLVSAAVLFAMHLSGSAIHQMSIYGMIIALGLLIDNAIVMADEVTRNKSSGDSNLAAVKHAVAHLFFPLLASTATTILAFMPIVLLEGSVGDFVSSIGSTVIIALIASFIIAMTLIAALAGLFAEPIESSASSWWQSGIRSESLAARFKAFYAVVFTRPAVAILLAIFLPIAGFLVATQLGNQFFPPVDRDMFEVKVWMPNNTSIHDTHEKTQHINQLILEDNNVESVQWLVGGSFPTVYYNAVMHRDESPYFAHAIVKMTNNDVAKQAISPLQDLLIQRFPEAQILVRQFAQGPPIFEDIEYRVFGPSVDVLREIGQTLRLALQHHPDVLITQASIPRGEPKLVFSADEEEAQLVGLTLQNISDQLQANLEGTLGGLVLEDLEQLPVRVRVNQEHRSQLDVMQNMQLVSPASDEWIPLSTVGTFTLEPELAGITHYDGLRVNRVKAFVKNGALPIDIANSVLAELERNGFTLPAGYRIEQGGALEQDDIAVANIVEHLPLLLFVIVAILILLFNSISVSLLLGAVAVFSLGLGFLSTWSMGFPISFNTILGTLGLLGLAFNNSIIVLAAIYANEDAKAGDIPSIIDAVMGTSRHILSTTLTTIGGFLPILLFVGGDFWPSLSIVLAGGVAGSMILALLFIPAAYVLLTRKGVNAHRGKAPLQPIVEVQS